MCFTIFKKIKINKLSICITQNILNLFFTFTYFTFIIFFLTQLTIKMIYNIFIKHLFRLRWSIFFQFVKIFHELFKTLTLFINIFLINFDNNIDITMFCYFKRFNNLMSPMKLLIIFSDCINLSFFISSQNINDQRNGFWFTKNNITQIKICCDNFFLCKHLLLIMISIRFLIFKWHVPCCWFRMSTHHVVNLQKVIFSSKTLFENFTISTKITLLFSLQLQFIWTINLILLKTLSKYC